MTEGRGAEVPAAEPWRSTRDLQELVAAFEATTLPYRAWTHTAHLSVGFWYVAWYGAHDALAHMRRGLKRYNAAHASEPMRVGYHETITRFWLWAIGEHLRQIPFDRPLGELANGVIAECADRELPFRYYSRAHLMSDEARATWVEPDLQPLGAHSAAQATALRGAS